MAMAQRLSNVTVRPSVLALTLCALDATAIVGGGQVAADLVMPALEPLIIFGMIWLGALVNMGVTFLAGGYGFRAMREMAASLVVGMASLLLSIMLLFQGMDYLVPDAYLALGWVQLWVLIAAAFMVLVRFGLYLRIMQLTRTGRLEHRIVLVGAGDDLAPLIREIQRDRGRGRRLCGIFDDRTSRSRVSAVLGFEPMGDINDLVAFARLAKIDTVIISIPKAPRERIEQLIERLFVLPIDIRVVEGCAVPEHSSRRLSRIGPIKLLEIYKRPIGGLKAFEKRVFDIVFALIGIILFAPLMLFIALLIKLESRGPVLFKQKRHGFNNKPIEVLKFRSMYVDQCDATAVRAVRRGDARVTRIGRFIRRASIDELPQFFNVLRGELSMVGPRPHAMAARTGDIEYDQVADSYSARHKVKPGVTGWAQINGWRGEMNSSEKIHQRVKHDLYYIENWSIWFDLKIVLLTPWSLVTTKNAY